MGRPPKPIEDNNWKLAKTQMPNPPELAGEAGDEWQRISRYLVALDRVAAIDRMALSSYCIEWSKFCRLMRNLSDEDEYLYNDGPSCEVLHPLIPPTLRSAREVIRLAGLFGMTARTRDLESDHGNRKASALKRLMGNQRKIAIGKTGVSVLPMLPDFGDQDLRPPVWLNAKANEEYYELGEQLKQLDLFTPLDRAPITIAACMFELYIRAVSQISDLTTSVVNKQGTVVSFKEHPLLRGSNEILEALHVVWKDYAQTPRYRKVFNGEQKIAGKDIPIVFKGQFGA